MLRSVSVALVVLMATAGGAMAQGMCGDPPIAPDIPSPADIQHKSPADAATARHNAFADIKRWQGALQSYRQCLDASVNTNKRDLGEAARSDKPDKDKLAKFQQQITDAGHAFDESVDEEERVVNEFHAAQVAYCTRSDVDRATCPKT